ncbi:MAG TPA: hypothetical protein VFY29_04805 [Terriglobia bacterium]|nr:hypothetical protein [Terriglobia bacterium]
MSQLAFNGTCSTINPTLATWQELLTDLESRRLADNEVIASVSFDGDEVIQFREAAVLNTPLESLSEVRVEARAKDDMLRDAMEEAGQYLNNLKTATLDVAELFRREKLAEANPAISQLLEGIKLFVGLLRGIELSLSGIEVAGASVVERSLNAMGTTLEEQIAAQTALDWMLLADILEYDLLPHLSAFEDILAGFKSRIANA